MSLETNVSDLATAIATELKKTRVFVNGNAPDLSGLNTTSKNSLVAAINEVASSIGEAGASINDGTPSTLSVWSSDKTNAEISSRIAAILDAAPDALNTLNELAAALGDDPSFATTITTSIGEKVSKSGAETIAGVKTFSSAPVVPDAAFVIGKVSGLQAALDLMAPKESPALTGTPTAPTAPLGTSTTQLATTAFVAGRTGDASTTAKGVVELSTDAEAVAGVSGTLAVTPANLLAYVGDPNEDFVATFEAGLV